MANIHSFESMAALDGEGIRFDIFLTGCPLRCAYCHNPDTWHRGDIDMTPQQVVAKAKRYKPYFRNGGGVTFSGGEPLLNADFINDIYPLLRQEGIGYCLDTSGSVELTPSVARAIDNADMVILDIKFYDPDDYRRYTGGDFDLFVRVGGYCTSVGKRLWLRTVIVPGINDTEQDVKRYAALASRFDYEKYELLAFHTMGFFKYDELGIVNPLAGTAALSNARLAELQRVLDNAVGGQEG